MVLHQAATQDACDAATSSTTPMASARARARARASGGGGGGGHGAGARRIAALPLLFFGAGVARPRLDARVTYFMLLRVARR